MVAGKKAISSSQSSSSHPVALTQAQLPRVPKRKKGSSPNDQRENKLAKRFCSHKELCSHKDDEQDDKERCLSNTQAGRSSMKANRGPLVAKKRLLRKTPVVLRKKKAGSSSQSNAPQPAALTRKQQKLVDDIRRLGRMPKCLPLDRNEYNLYMRYYRQKKNLPEDLVQSAIWQAQGISVQEDDKADTY